MRLELADVKRVSRSKQVPDALEVESVTGQVYYVGILDGRLTLTSPGKAAQFIQRAVQTALAAATRARALRAGWNAGLIHSVRPTTIRATRKRLPDDDHDRPPFSCPS